MISDAPSDPYASAPPLPAALLPTLLAVSLSAVNLQRPVYGPDGTEIVDFTIEYLNPAAQRMTGLPERPSATALARFPEMAATGVFDFYCRTYRSGEPGTFEVNYQHDGLDNYYRLAAQRCEDLLLISFTDTADQPRTAVELALRAAQAAEQAARADAEAQRARLHDVLLDMPAYVAIYRGPAHTYEFVNRNFQQTMPGRSLPGRTVREALPELEGQAYLGLLGQVYQTGTPFQGREIPSQVDYTGTGRLEQRYHNFYVRATRDPAGAVDGLLSFAYDVTEQVVARQQLRLLNQELEGRVFERTQALRHAQAAAEATAQRLLHITDSLPSTTFTTDPTGRVGYISPQWYAYTGMGPDADINAVWPALIHPDDLPAIAQEFGAALAEGRAWAYEFRLRGAAGHYRWFASQGVPEPLATAQAAGRPREWFGSNLDIDDLKQAQHAREQQEHLLATILAALPASVATLEGEALRYTFFNDTFQQLVHGRAVLGRSLGELFPEAEEQGFPDRLRQVLRTGEPFRAAEAPAHVLDPRTGARQEVFLDLTYLPLCHGSQPPHAVLTFRLDVTARVRARQEAEALQAALLAAAGRQAQERAAFHEVFEQTTALVALLRLPGHVITYANPAFQALFPGQPFAGRAVAAALPELQELGVLDLLDRVGRTGEPYFGAELPFSVAPAAGPPARREYYNFTFQAFREAGAVAGVSVFGFNVTEQVLARREREAQQQRLQAANAALTESNVQLTRTNHDLDTFVYTASHDLKTPIANLEGLLHGLREELPADLLQGRYVPRLLGHMQGAVDRFKLTLAQLTDITRLQRAGAQAAEPVDLAALVADIRLDLAQQLAGDARLAVDVTTCPHVSFAPKHLRSIVYNLLSNALKYRSPARPPRVALRCRRTEDGAVVLDVQDNGLGLTRAQQGQLFGLFRRLHDHVEGSGVGLYMVKRIVENAGGTIAVHSTPDVGTTFTVTLPAPPRAG